MNSKLPARAIFLSHLSLAMQLYRASGITHPGRVDFVGAPLGVWRYLEHSLNPAYSQTLVFVLGLFAGAGLFLAQALSQGQIRALMTLLLLGECSLLSLDVRLCGRSSLLLLLATATYVVAKEAGARSWLAVFPANLVQGLLLWPILALSLLQSPIHERWRTLFLIALVMCGLWQGDIDLLLLAFPLALSLPEGPPPFPRPRTLAVCLVVFIAMAPLFWPTEASRVRINLIGNHTTHVLVVANSNSGTSVTLDGVPLKTPWREEKTILCNPYYFTRCKPYALQFDLVYRRYCEEVSRRTPLRSAEFQRLSNP